VLQLTAQFVTLAVMPALLMEHFGLPLAYLPVAVIIFGICGVAGNWIAGQWIDRSSAAIPMVASFIGMALALAALALPLGGWGGAAALAGIAFCGTLFRPAQLMLFTGLVTAEERGPALGLNTAASYIGLAFGSVISALIVTSFGFGAVGAAGLVPLLIAWLCVRKPAFLATQS
jgi:predicted MFS family arabinose efflux permease